MSNSEASSIPKQLRIFRETVGKNISSNFGEYENYSQDTAYQLLLNEVLLSIRDSLRHMKKLGIHDGTAFEDINATKIYRKMKKFKPSDNESIMNCLSDEDKSDVLNFVPGARQAM